MAETPAAEVTRKYREWKVLREPHEQTWFVTGAMLRGQQHVEYDPVEAKLVEQVLPSYAIKIDLNKMRPKHRARMAKFLKNRPKPISIPASTQYQDLMDARATERAIRYQMDRLQLERKYREARLWASVSFKSYWWIGFDPTVPGRVETRDPITQQLQEETVPLGDVTTDVSSAWEVLVADPAIAHIGQQPEIMRVRSLPRVEAEARFPALKKSQGGVDALGTDRDMSDRLAGLKAGGTGTTPPIKRDDEVLLLEHYTAPNTQFPKGRKVVVCGGVEISDDSELPFGFWDHPSNPYPCVEFSDGDSPGQFWGSTWLEQLVPLQRALNHVIRIVLENLEAVGRPKIVTYTQHQLPDGAWTAAAGEVVELSWVPGLPPPQIVQPANIAGDAWNMVQLLLRQFDDISQMYPASEGGGASQESGYQTALLQEATDAVHAPDIRTDELAIEEWAWKVRRVMQLTWDTPRLILLADTGRAFDMIEFSNRQINDHAAVRIQIGSMLPDLKAAKAQIVLNYYKAGLLGDPGDPSVRRRALALIDATGVDVINDSDRLDDDQAERETQALMDGQNVDPAQFFHVHLAHLAIHEARMKTPEWALLPDTHKQLYVAHVIGHYDFVNVSLAMGLRAQYGLSGLPVAAPPPPPQPASAPSAPSAPALPAPGGPPPPLSLGPPAEPSPMTSALPPMLPGTIPPGVPEVL